MKNKTNPTYEQLCKIEETFLPNGYFTDKEVKELTDKGYTFNELFGKKDKIEEHEINIEWEEKQKILNSPDNVAHITELTNQIAALKNNP